MTDPFETLPHERIIRLLKEKKVTEFSPFALLTSTLIEDFYDQFDAPDRHGEPVCFTSFLRRATLTEPSAFPAGSPQRRWENYLLGRLRKFLHVNDKERAAGYTRIASPQGPSFDSFDEADHFFARMLCQLVFDQPSLVTTPPDLRQMVATIREYPVFATELQQLFVHSTKRKYRTFVPAGGLKHPALSIHADYKIGELLAAINPAPLGELLGAAPSLGWYRCEQSKTHLLTARLIQSKSIEAGPGRKAYAMTPNSWMWCTAPQTGPTSDEVTELVDASQSGWTILMAIEKNNIRDTAPGGFLLLGPCTYRRSTGTGPVNIEFTVDSAMPLDLCRQWLACGGC